MAAQNVQNSLAQKEKKTSFTAYLAKDAVKNQINSVVGSKNGSRFISSIVSAVQANPALQECTNPSILSAALLGEALNLSPSPQLGQYYLVPFRQKAKRDNRGNIISPECKVAQFQLGYKGYIQLAIRSGYYKKLNVLPIKEGELVRYDPLNEEIEVNLIEDDIERDEAPTIGYYAMFEYQNGFRKTLYWSRQKMSRHADKYSAAFSADIADQIAKGQIPQNDMWRYSSYWYSDFDGMAQKTMLRQLISKWGIMSIELQTAMDKDMAVIHEDGSAEYIENPPENNFLTAQAQPEQLPQEQNAGEPQGSGNQNLEDQFFTNGQK